MKTQTCIDALTSLLEHVGLSLSNERREQAYNALASLKAGAAREAADEAKRAELVEIGRGAYGALFDMVAALRCDYDRLEELRDMKEDGDTIMDADEAEELADLEAAAGDCESQDDARQRIEEDALSVEVRSDWQSLSEALTPSEFCILLTTGGPAVRILGELSEHGEPHRAWLEVQDWGTPWTEVRCWTNDKGEACSVDADVLLAYAQCFYFGE